MKSIYKKGIAILSTIVLSLFAFIFALNIKASNDNDASGESPNDLQANIKQEERAVYGDEEVQEDGSIKITLTADDIVDTETPAPSAPSLYSANWEISVTQKSEYGGYFLNYIGCTTTFRSSDHWITLGFDLPATVNSKKIVGISSNLATRHYCDEHWNYSRYTTTHDNQLNVTYLRLPSSIVYISDNAFARTNFKSTRFDLSACANLQYIGANAFSNENGGTRTIEKFASNQTKLVTIGAGAFYNAWPTRYKENKSIIAPRVQSIGNYAFYNCTGLAAFNLDDNSVISSIGTYAFYNCIRLETITLPSSIGTIGDYAFRSCTNISSANIYTNSLKNTGIFYDCMSLSGIMVTSPNLLTKIGAYTFYNCTKLIGISTSLFARVESIGDYAFYYTQFTNFVIPEPCTSIGKGAFKNSKLISVDFSRPSSLAIADEAFAECAELASLTITNNITSIGKQAFQNCTSLETVTYQNQQNLLNDYMFDGCSDLNSVTFYNQGTNISSIPKYCFRGCSSLRDLEIIKTDIDNNSDIESNALVNIGEFAFYGAGFRELSLTKSTLSTIGENAFAYMPDLVEVTINIPNISEKMFFHNIKLDKLTIGSTVSTVGSYAFSECGLTNITLQNAIMGDYMFYDCDSLLSIVIPASITTIGKFALADCTYLNSVTLSNSVLGVSMFERDNNLTQIILSEDMKAIPARAFANSFLTSIVIPASVIYVGDEAFMDSKNLANVTINNHILGKSMFEGCTSIQTITIPSTEVDALAKQEAANILGVNVEDVPDIPATGARTFFGCTGLVRADISSINMISESMFEGCSSLVSNNTQTNKIIIPATVGLNVGDRAFFGCTSISYYENLANKVSARMFEGCKSLREATLETAITQVGNYAFKDCTALSSVVIKNGVTSVGQFMGDSSITTVTFQAGVNGTIPFSNVTTIKESMFENCIGITSLNIDFSKIETIEAKAFKNCKTLETITVNDGVKSIGEAVFSGCSRLSTLSIPFVGASVNSASSTASASSTFGYMFGTTSYENSTASSFLYSANASYTAYIPNSLVEVKISKDNAIKRGAFSNIKGAAGLKVIIPNTVSKIEDYAFYDSDSLSEADIPSSVSNIGTYVFAECGSLSKVTVNGTVLGTHMFENCIALNTAYLNSLRSVNEYAFNGCTGLVTVELNSSNQVGSNLTLIKQYAFNGCSKIEYLGLPDDIETIEQYAFNGCTKLYLHSDNYNISFLPANLTTLGQYAFNNCDGLVYVVAKANLTSVGTYAFANSNKLKYFEFRGTTLGTYMFANDDKLDTVYFNESTQTIPEGAFYNCTGLLDISLPSSLKTLGASAFRKSGLVYVHIPQNVTSIGTYSFAEMPKLEKASFDNAVMSAYIFYNSTKLNEVTYSNSSFATINEYAFYGCTSFTNLTWPSNLKTIGTYAFANIYNLKDLVVPNTVTTIERNAFFNDDVVNLTIPFIGYKRDISNTLYTNTYESTHRSTQTHLGYIFGAGTVIHGGSGYYGAFEAAPYTTGRSYTVTYYNEGGGLEPDYVDTMHVAVPSSLRTITVTNDPSIPWTALQGLSTVTKLTIGNATTYINEGILYGMSSLKELTIPFVGRTADISNTTWYNSDIKQTGTSTNNTTWLFGYLFSHYTRFAGYYGSGDGNRYANNYNYQSFDTTNTYNTLTQRYNTSGSTVSYYIPKTLETINITNQKKFGVGALSNMATLKVKGTNNFVQININTNNLVEIRDYAFTNTPFTSFEVPSTVTTVGTYAFNGSTRLASVVLNNSIVSNYMFNGCTSLSSVTYNGANTTIGTGAFTGCTAFTSIYLPSNVTSVGDSAFAGCKNITRFETNVIGSSQSGKNATFASMFGTSSVDGMTKVTPYYAQTSSETRYLPSGLQTIILHGRVNQYAFANIKTLGDRDHGTDILLSDDTTFIGAYAFWKSSIISIRIPYGVVSKVDNVITTNLGEGIFKDCSSLTTVVFAEGITTIPNYMFKNATALAAVNFESSTFEREIRYVSNNVYRAYERTAGAEGPNLTNYTALNEYISAGPDKEYGTTDDIEGIIRVSDKFYIDNGNGTYMAYGKDNLLGTDDDIIVDISGVHKLIETEGVNTPVDLEALYFAENRLNLYVTSDNTNYELTTDLVKALDTTYYLRSGEDPDYTYTDVTANMASLYFDAHKANLYTKSGNTYTSCENDTFSNVEYYNRTTNPKVYYKDYENGTYSLVTINFDANANIKYTYTISDERLALINEAFVPTLSFNNEYFVATDLGNNILRAAGRNGILGDSDDKYRVLVTYDKTTNTYSLSANDITDVEYVGGNFYKTYYDNVYQLITITEYHATTYKWVTVYNANTLAFDNTKTYYANVGDNSYVTVNNINTFEELLAQGHVFTYTPEVVNYSLVQAGDSFDSEKEYYKMESTEYVLLNKTDNSNPDYINATNIDTWISQGLYVKVITPESYDIATSYNYGTEYYTYDSLNTSYNRIYVLDYQNMLNDNKLYVQVESPSGTYSVTSDLAYNSSKTYYLRNGEDPNYTYENALAAIKEAGFNNLKATLYKEVSENTYELVGDDEYNSSLTYYSDDQGVVADLISSGFESLKASLYEEDPVVISYNLATGSFNPLTTYYMQSGNSEPYTYNLLSIIYFDSVKDSYYLASEVEVVDNPEVAYSVAVGELFSAGSDLTPGTDKDILPYDANILAILNDNQFNVANLAKHYASVIVGEDGFHYLVLKETEYKSSAYNTRKEIYVQFGKDRMLGTADDIITSKTNITSPIVNPTPAEFVDLHPAGYVAYHSMPAPTLNENTMTSSFVTIGVEAFFNTSSLRSLTLSSNLKTIGAKAFLYSGLESITVPASVEVIGSYAFAYNQNMVEATIDSTVNGDYMFAENHNLEKAKITENTRGLSDGMFYNCNKLITVVFITHYAREVRVPIPMGEEMSEEDAEEADSKRTAYINEVLTQVTAISTILGNEYTVEDANGVEYFNIKGNIYYEIEVVDYQATISKIVYKYADEDFYRYNVEYFNDEYYVLIPNTGIYVRYDSINNEAFAFSRNEYVSVASRSYTSGTYYVYENSSYREVTINDYYNALYEASTLYLRENVYTYNEANSYSAGTTYYVNVGENEYSSRTAAQIVSANFAQIIANTPLYVRTNNEVPYTYEEASTYEAVNHYIKHESYYDTTDVIDSDDFDSRKASLFIHETEEYESCASLSYDGNKTYYVFVPETYELVTNDTIITNNFTHIEKLYTQAISYNFTVVESDTYDNTKTYYISNVGSGTQVSMNDYFNALKNNLYANEVVTHISGGVRVIHYNDQVHEVTGEDGIYYEKLDNQTNLYNKWVITGTEGNYSYSSSVVAKVGNEYLDTTVIDISGTNTYVLTTGNPNYYYLMDNDTLSRASTLIYSVNNGLTYTYNNVSHLYIHNHLDYTQERLDLSNYSVSLFWVGANKDQNLPAIVGNNGKHYIPLGDGAFIGPKKDESVLYDVNVLNNKYLYGVSTSGLIGNASDRSLVKVGNNLYIDHNDNTYSSVTYEATSTPNVYTPTSVGTRIVGAYGNTASLNAAAIALAKPISKIGSSYYIDRLDGTYQLAGEDGLFNTSDDVIYLMDHTKTGPSFGLDTEVMVDENNNAKYVKAANDYQNIAYYIYENGAYTLVSNEDYFNAAKAYLYEKGDQYDEALSYQGNVSYYTFDGVNYNLASVSDLVNTYFADILTNVNYYTFDGANYNLAVAPYSSLETYYEINGTVDNYNSLGKISESDYNDKVANLYTSDGNNYVPAESYDADTVYFEKVTVDNYVAVTLASMFENNFAVISASGHYLYTRSDKYTLTTDTSYVSSKFMDYYVEALNNTYVVVTLGYYYNKLNEVADLYILTDYVHYYNNLGHNVVRRWTIGGDNTLRSYSSVLVALESENHPEIISGRTVSGVTTEIIKIGNKYYLSTPSGYYGYGFDNKLNTDDDSIFISLLPSRV